MVKQFLWLLMPAALIAGNFPDQLARGQATVPGDGMVWIPGGEFTMGTDDENSFPNERPAHRVKVAGFWMDETEVTNAQFRKFTDATGYQTIAERAIDWEELKKQVPPGTPKPPAEALQPGSLVFVPPNHAVDLRDMSQWWVWTTGANWRHPYGPTSTLEGKDNHPVLHIAYEDAAAYAKWSGKRLPSEAEWEFACRGGLEQNRYAWGEEFMPKASLPTKRYLANVFTGEFPHTNTEEDGYALVAPVKSFPANGYGLYEMTGNVWEWTSDLYRADAHGLALREANRSPSGCCDNPRGPATSYDPTRPMPDTPQYVTKGGSFLCHPSYCESYRPSARRGTPPDTGTTHVGFRCVMDAKGPTSDRAHEANDR